MNRQVVARALVYTLVFVLSALFFIPVNYPSGKLSGHVNNWIASVSEGKVTAGSARMRFPYLIELEGVAFDPGGRRSIDLGKSVIRPRLLPLLSGKRTAAVSLENPWLDLKLEITRSGDRLILGIREAGIDLAMLPESLLTIPVELEGEVRLSMELEGRPGQEIQSGDVKISSGPVSIGGTVLETFGLAPLGISSVSGVASVKDNIVTLGENGIEGDLNASAKGVIRLSLPDYLGTSLDLDVELAPAPGKREKFGTFFKMMGARVGADGSVNIKVRGTAGRPSVTM